MGYITPSSEIISVMEWPFQAPYGQVPLGEFDVSLIRAIYSESTCPSTFNPVIQANIKAKQEAELKAKQEAELKAKQEAELKAKQEAEAYAAAEVKAKQEADAKAAAEKLVVDARAEALKILAAAKTAALKKVTITCIKGKLTKKVTAAKPKCPAGYKKK
jgi:regulator of protease activity HflC (stomatin/prohibitin superfamily)